MQSRNKKNKEKEKQKREKEETCPRLLITHDEGRKAVKTVKTLKK